MTTYILSRSRPILESFDRDLLLHSIKNAKSSEAVVFLGQVLRVQSLNELPHTLDEEFMDSCRSAYEERLSHFRREDERLRQFDARGAVQERKSNRREQATSVSGELRDRRQGVLDLQLDQHGEIGGEVYELEL